MPPGFTDYALRVKILADGYQAKAEILTVDTLLEKMGGGLASKFGGLAVPIGSVVAGITALGGGLLALSKDAAEYGSQIYDASQKTGLHAQTLAALKLAADRSGSSLEEVSAVIVKFNKTIGEAAQGNEKAIETLKRLGIEPREAIKDLDGTLAKVIERIALLPDPVSRGTAAMQLFGKAGSNILKVIDDMHGDLPGAIREVKRLGLGMSDEGAKAADEFGDQLDTLQRQIHGVAMSIGRDFIPIFQKYTKQMSDWLTQHPVEAKRAASAFGEFLDEIVRRFKQDQKDLDTISGFFEDFWSTLTNDSQSWDRFMDKRAARSARMAKLAIIDKNAQSQLPKAYTYARPGDFKSGQDYLDNLEAQKKAEEEAAKQRKDIAKRDAAARVDILRGQLKQSEELYQRSADRAMEILRESGDKDNFSSTFNQIVSNFGASIGEIIPQLEAAEKSVGDIAKNTTQEWVRLQEEQKDRATKITKLSTDLHDQAMAAMVDADKETADKAKADAEEKVRIAQDEMGQTLAVYQAGYDDRLALQDFYLASGLAKESDYAREVGRIRYEQILDEIELNKKLLSNTGLTAEQRIALDSKITVLKKQLGTQIIKTATDVSKALKQEADSADEAAEKAKKLRGELAELAAEAARATREGTITGGIARGLGVDLVSIFSDENIGVIKSQAEFIKSIYADMSQFAGEAIGSMVDSLVNMGVAWLMTGEFSAKAALQMLASTAMSIAVQAYLKGAFELAEMAAAMARYDFYSAGLHQAAAGMYFTTAAIATAAGIGLALAGRAVGGGGGGGGRSGGGGGGTGGSSSSSQENQPPQTYSRVSNDAYISGRRSDPMTATLDRLNNVLDKLEPMSAGEVLTKGMQQRPGVVGEQVVADVKRNSGTGTRLLTASGLR